MVPAGSPKKPPLSTEKMLELGRDIDREMWGVPTSKQDETRKKLYALIRTHTPLFLEKDRQKREDCIAELKLPFAVPSRKDLLSGLSNQYHGDLERTSLQVQSRLFMLVNQHT